MAVAQTWEIKEIEGATRWGLVLRGRSRPLRDNALNFGIHANAEDWTPHGQSEGRSEPTSITYPDLVMRGEWKVNFFPGSFDVSPKRSIPDPQALAEWMVEFASRQKVVEITTSLGFIRVGRIKSVDTSFGRGEDRTWTLTLAILGKGSDLANAELTRKRNIARADFAALQRNAMSLDQALANFSDAINSGFVDQIQGAFAGFREGLASLRRAMQTVSDITRIPLDTLHGIVNLAAQARNLGVEAYNTFDQIGAEYQCAFQNAESLLSTRLWQDGIKAALLVNLDAILAMLDAAEARLATSTGRITVQPGDSLKRIAVKIWGSQAQWQALADANGIVGQRVPVGVYQLLVPG